MIAWFKKLFKENKESKPKNYFVFGNMVSTKSIYFSDDLSIIYGTNEMHCGEHGIDGTEDHKINKESQIAKLAYIWRRMEAYDIGVGSLYINGRRYKSHSKMCDHIESLVLDFLRNASSDEQEIYHSRLAWFRTNWSW